MLQCVRRCSDFGTSSKTNAKYRKIGLALVCTLFAFLTPMSDAFAVSKEEQKRCYDYARGTAVKLNVQLDRRTIDRIRRYCFKGDTRGAVRLVHSRADASADRKSGGKSVDARSCVKEVTEYANKHNVRIGRDAQEKIFAYCRRGDIQSAKSVVKSEARASTEKRRGDQSVDARSCVREVREYAEKLDVSLDRDAHAKIAGYCRRGDTRSAKRVVASVAKASRGRTG
jgi:RNase P subunit RPR2